MTARSLLLLAALNGAIFHLGAQQPQATAARAEFEVASVKPNKTGDGGMSIDSSKGMWRATNITPEWLIINSFDILPEQIVGAPSWTRSERFDIEGKFDADETAAGSERAAQRKERLQALLAGRFQFHMHREAKEWQSYVLVVGKNGPKLKHSEADGTSMSSTNGHMECKGMTMENLSGNLAFRVGRPVVDQTGLTGTFDFTLEYEEEGQPAENHAASLFTALQDQLGLKLEAKKAPVQMLVVDRIERPGAN